MCAKGSIIVRKAEVAAVGRRRRLRRTVARIVCEGRGLTCGDSKYNVVDVPWCKTRSKISSYESRGSFVWRNTNQSNPNHGPRKTWIYHLTHSARGMIISIQK